MHGLLCFSYAQPIQIVEGVRNDRDTGLMCIPNKICARSFWKIECQLAFPRRSCGFHGGITSGSRPNSRSRRNSSVARIAGPDLRNSLPHSDHGSEPRTC